MASSKIPETGKRLIDELAEAIKRKQDKEWEFKQRQKELTDSFGTGNLPPDQRPN